MGSDQSAVRSWPIVVWIRSFIEPYLFDNDVPFDNTTPIVLTNLLWKLGLGLAMLYEADIIFSLFKRGGEGQFMSFRDGVSARKFMTLCS